MRRPDPASPSGLEGILPYALVGVFTILFWAATLLLWRLACPSDTCVPPNAALTLFALPLPFLGYWALMHTPAAEGRRFNALTYIGIEVLALIFWGIAVWLWLQAYIWYAFVADLTFILVFLLMLLPYVAVIRSISSPGAPPTAPPAGDRPAPATPSPSDGSSDWAGSWLKWMGNGETHRGTLVILVLVFWTILFWNWPNPNLQSMSLVLKFPIWGLITIFGLIIIRQIFFRQTNLPPSQEVSAADQKKSK
jgi:hypothetical protein